jgi:hypothetical protein
MMNFIVVHGQRPSKLMNDEETKLHELCHEVHRLLDSC